MSALVRLCAVAAFVAAVAQFVVGAAALAQTPTPAQQYGGTSQDYAGELNEVVVQLDIFWLDTFDAAGMPYQSPPVVPLASPMTTGCGPAGPEDFAFFCPRDDTIYYSPWQLAQHAQEIGDFATMVVIAHEWGHHVQWMAGAVPEPGNAFELQADCLAGAYALDASQQGLLDPGDITEAVAGSASAGDPLGLPQDAPGAHGINDDRVISFMRGYFDGVSGCGLPLSAIPELPSAPATAPVLSLNALLPATLPLPQGQSFRIDDEGISTFEDMVAGLPDPVRTRDMLLEWQWQENVYRTYAAEDARPDAATWITLGIHRFASVDGAAAALPYFAAARRDATGYQLVDVGLFADQTEAMAGESGNGAELIIYARRGNLVFRADGVAASGDPTADVFETLLIPLRELVDEPHVVSPELCEFLPTARDLDPGLQLAEEHARSAGSIAATFGDSNEAEDLFQQWGWRESAARVFTETTPIGTTRVEVSVFRLGDEQAAAEALPYFLDARAAALGLAAIPVPAAMADDARAVSGSVADGEEVTVYLRRGANLFRVSAIGDDDPMGVLTRLLASW